MVLEFDVVFCRDDEGYFWFQVSEEVTCGEGVVVGAEGGFLN